MEFIIEFGFNCKQGMSQEMQEWLAANEEKLAAAAPEGCSYIGTYVAIYTSEKHAGAYRNLWRLDSYGAQDNFAAAMKGGDFATLVGEFTERFVDQDSKADWSNGLYKRVTDATIWGE